MESDDDFMQFSDSENRQPSPLPQRKLKRLRKAKEADIPTIPQPSPGHNETSSFHEVNSNSNSISSPESLDTLKTSSHGEEEVDGLKDGIELDSGIVNNFDVEENQSNAKRALDFEESDAESEDLAGNEVEVQNQELRADLGLDLDSEKKWNTESEDSPGADVEVQNEELRADLGLDSNSYKKRKDFDLFDENREGKKKNKKKRVENSLKGSFDEYNLYSAYSTKKERRERLTDLRSESQRLLRESRDASFKPVPFVQKSVSSVLEKIRKRKHELSNKYAAKEVILDVDFEATEDVGCKVIEADSVEMTSSVDVDGCLGARSAEVSKEISNDGPQMDLAFDSQISDSKDEPADVMPSSPLEDVMAPSLLAMNLKLDSAPPDDYSSDEEDNDKENIDPGLQGSADLPLSPRGDPVKAFVEDEAEEEDDSDNDLARFKDDEEDEDAMDSEEFNDIIATGYEEKPMDNEMRNQLHQQWLEQQDDVGTENLLQKLKCGSKPREEVLIEDEEDKMSDEAENDILDDPAEHVISKNTIRMNLKKAKEMICQMFTDKDDVYVSSDDEESEERFAKQRFSDRTEEQAAFLSPAEVEGSKEIFGLIKKLNGVPETRRRTKIASHFHALSIGGNKTASSKSSFLSLKSRNSLPSLQKHGSTTVRSFVFERDDSNSRSAISASEDSSDVVQNENRPKKTTFAKYTGSQVITSSQSTQIIAEKSSGPSLHEILKCQSLQSKTSSSSMTSHVEAIYASFKLDQTLAKRERVVHLRAV